MENLELKFEGLPPSVNKLYFYKGGRRILSSSGRSFKTRFIMSGGGASKLDLMNFKPTVDKKYTLVLLFFVRESRLVNKGYGKNKRAKYKFKAFDVTNLVKVTEDAIQELLGIPDQNNFTVIQRKIPIPDDDQEFLLGYIGPENSADTVAAVQKAICYDKKT